MLEIKGVCNHPAPGENIILNMGRNSTQDWLRKTLWLWQDGSNPRLLQEEGWSVMKRPDFPFSDVYPAGRAGRISRV